jgi:hypothetical protein
MPLPSSESGFTQHGKFYTTTAPTDANKVAALVGKIRKAFLEPGAKKQMVWILSGTHGDTNGDLVREKDFFYEDKGQEGQTYKSVNVWGFTKDDGSIVKTRWSEYTGKTGVVILAWCYSEKSRTGWMKKEGLT